MKTKLVLSAVAIACAVAYVAIPFRTIAADSTIYVGRGPGQSAAKLAGTMVDGGFSISTHERGYQPTVGSGACVLCSVYGDGGTITVTPGQLYAAKAVDQNGSPVTFAESAACGAFASAGNTMQAGGTEYYVGGAAFSDGGLPYLTCCAQTATASPAGPYLCVTPIQ